MLSLAVPPPIIGRALGYEGDLVSSSSLLSGRNEINKRHAVIGGHKLTLQGGGKGGGQAADDGGRYVAGGWRLDERRMEADMGRVQYPVERYVGIQDCHIHDWQPARQPTIPSSNATATVAEWLDRRFKYLKSGVGAMRNATTRVGASRRSR